MHIARGREKKNPKQIIHSKRERLPKNLQANNFTRGNRIHIDTAVKI